MDAINEIAAGIVSLAQSQATNLFDPDGYPDKNLEG